MLTEMAQDEPRRRAGAADPSGLLAQPFAGDPRRHSAATRASISRPAPTTSTALKPLLDRVGMRARPDRHPLHARRDRAMRASWRRWPASIPALKLGPAWWFHDSPEGMRRFREMTTETAGFYNTVGFNDDTRAFPSIPARHDVARRVDCAFLARLVAEHRLARGRGARACAGTGLYAGEKGVPALTGACPICKREETHVAFFETGGGHAARRIADGRNAPARRRCCARPTPIRTAIRPSRRVKYFGELVKERTAGRYSVEVYHSAQLGEEKDTIEQVRSGVIDLNRVSMAPFNGTRAGDDRSVAALYLPLGRPHAQGHGRRDRRPDQGRLRAGRPGRARLLRRRRALLLQLEEADQFGRRHGRA